MAIYAIGDLHLSEGVEKPMDIFGGWQDYTNRLIQNWTGKITAADTVVLAGDISWGLKFSEALPDFQFIHRLPGRKLILKGNHDLWWGSVSSMNASLQKEGIDSIEFLHNNSYLVENLAVCGSRGWLFENGEEHNAKLVNRETMRMEASLASVRDFMVEKVMFLHYPPLYGEQELSTFLDVMLRYNVKRCYYGHIHGLGHRHAVQGEVYGIHFQMISADYLKFDPVLVQESLA